MNYFLLRFRINKVLFSLNGLRLLFYGEGGTIKMKGGEIGLSK